MKRTFAFIKNEEGRMQVKAKLNENIAKLAGAGGLLETYIKEFTPVKTGNLQGSFIGSMTGWAKGQVETNIVYAPFIEYGTGSQSDFPEGSKHPEMKGIAPRAMMRKGADKLYKMGTDVFKDN